MPTAHRERLARWPSADQINLALNGFEVEFPDIDFVKRPIADRIKPTFLILSNSVARPTVPVDDGDRLKACLTDAYSEPTRSYE